MRSPNVANNESAQWMAPVMFVSDLRWSDQPVPLANTSFKDG